MTLRNNHNYTRIYRTYRTWILQDEGSNRDASYRFLEAAFNDGFQHLDQCNAGEERKQRIMFDAIRNALGALENMEATYKDDAMFTSKIQSLSVITRTRLDLPH